MIHRIFKPILILCCLILLLPDLYAEEKTKPKRSWRHAHAHNDYRHPNPLHDALGHGFCSVEADIFLVDGILLVGHSREELKPGRTLSALYLNPLRKIAHSNKGRVQPDYPWFTLMIDIKSDGQSTYRELAKVLKKYDDILTSVNNGKVTPRSIRVVISGNRAWDEIESATSRHCGIDGRLSDLDSEKPTHLMPMISDNWGKHFRWHGDGPIPIEENEKLIKIVKQAHRAGRAVRFWNTPEKKSVWKVLYDADVDLINTDQLKNLSLFLKEESSNSLNFYPVKSTNESGSQLLTGVNIRGKRAHIHTQGLYVSPHYFYVTGRLNEHPRRALLLRFSRAERDYYEYLDITPGEEYTKRNKAILDHPGGFDCDGKYFWIPISASNRKSISVIVKVPFNDFAFLKNASPETVFEVNDHIGALAIDSQKEKLYGANWDTLISYCWSLSGEELARIPKNQLIKNDPNQHIAVQDWKSMGNDIVIMGGLDKRSERSPLASRALVEVINMRTHERLGRARLFGSPSFTGNLTHEGFHFNDKFLYFLPNDIGSGASYIYRYHWRKMGQ